MASAPPGQASRTIFPEPPGLDAVAGLLGQNGQAAKGQVAGGFRVAAVELVGTLEGQAPPPAGFALGLG